LIAGQPPNGCDNLPVVEIKLPGKIGIGSKGAFKPDLIAAKGGVFLIIECKPDHSPSDVDKLRGIIGNRERILLLYEEINQRKLLRRRGIDVTAKDFCGNIKGAIAHSGKPIKLPGLYVLCIEGASGKGKLLMPG